MLHLLTKNHLQHLSPYPEGMNCVLRDFFLGKFPFRKAPSLDGRAFNALTSFRRFSPFDIICWRQVMMRFSSKIPDHQMIIKRCESDGPDSSSREEVKRREWGSRFTRLFAFLNLYKFPFPSLILNFRNFVHSIPSQTSKTLRVLKAFRDFV